MYLDRLRPASCHVIYSKENSRSQFCGGSYSRDLSRLCSDGKSVDVSGEGKHLCNQYGSRLCLSLLKCSVRAVWPQISDTDSAVKFENQL
jgi:hypothetical protein